MICGGDMVAGHGLRLGGAMISSALAPLQSTTLSRYMLSDHGRFTMAWLMLLTFPGGFPERPEGHDRRHATVHVSQRARLDRDMVFAVRRTNAIGTRTEYSA